MKKYALVVGVEEYRDSGFSSLPYARADAIALAERLRDRCHFDQVRLLADESGLDEPLLVNIVTGLRDISSDLQPEDLFLFFFAGHGMERDGHGYLLARDSLHVYPEHASLSLALLRKTFAYLAAGRRIVLMDACRNCPEVGRDEVDNTMGDGITRDIVAAAQSQWELPATTALFTACRSGQRAFEWPAKGHGVFTQCLLDGLDGSAWSEGRLEFSELARHTIAGVRAWMTRTPGRTGVQEPWYEQFGEPGPIYLAEPIDPRPSTSPPPVRPGRIEILKDPVLRVETTPAGARVKVDGKVRGTTPMALTLNAGEYRFQFELDGYHPIEQRIRYDAAGDARWKVSLKERVPVKPAFFPMTSAEAHEVQAVTAEALGLSVEITNSIGMKLRLIPPGEFLMGAPDSEKGRWGDEGPQHLVRITKPFYLGVFPVTQAEYEHVIGSNPSRLKGDPHCPAESVSCKDADAFCRVLSEQEKNAYRLPTEAEWEYACRAGSNTKWCFGDDRSLLKEYAWYWENSNGRAHRVGQKKPNAWYLYDMLGNVLEWCSDWFDRGYYGKSPTNDPTASEEATYRVVRGGSWRLDAGYCRSAYRDWGGPAYRLGDLGFRVAAVPLISES